jgi:hypothetical protein
MTTSYTRVGSLSFYGQLDNKIIDYITRLMSKQFYALSKKAGDDNLYSLKYRICNDLLSSLKDHQGKEVTLKVMRSKLSEKFGVTERSINRILKGLKEEKVLDITNASKVNLLLQLYMIWTLWLKHWTYRRLPPRKTFIGWGHKKGIFERGIIEEGRPRTSTRDTA